MHSSARRFLPLFLSLILAALPLPTTALAEASEPATPQANLTAQDDDGGEWSDDTPTEEVIASGTFRGMDWRITSGGALILGSAGQTQQLSAGNEMGYDSWPWYDYRATITSARVEGTVRASGSLAWMLSDCGLLTTADLSNLDTSAVTSMASLFADCTSLATLDVSSWNTSAVTDLSGLFGCCESLTTLDLSRWDTSSVTTMRNLFLYCSGLTSLNVSRWNTAAVTDMYALFSGCSSLGALDISAWNTSAVETMAWMFARCTSLTSLDPSSWDTSSVKDLSNLFLHCDALPALDLTGWNVSAATDLSWMFGHCKALAALDLSSWDTTAAAWMDCLFYGCTSLATLDLTGWTTTQATGTDDLFGNCTALAEIHLGTGCTKLSLLPSPAVSGGMWYSAEAGSWFTPQEITNDRLGIADTYTVVEADVPQNPFVDVTAKTAHYEHILWLAETGISAGWTEADGTKTFRPNATVKRGDMAAFLHRLDGVE